MTEREKLLGVFGKGPYGGTPWFADLSYYYGSLADRGLLHPAYAGDGLVDFHRAAGAGICFYAPPLYRERYAPEVECRVEKRGRDILTTYDTPLGSIRQEFCYSPQIYTYEIRKPYVENMQDLRVMAYVCVHTWYEKAYEAFQKTAEVWNRQGIAVALPPVCVSPLQTLLSRWAGVEKTVVLLMDEEEEFEELLHRIFHAQDPVFEILAESPAEVIEFADNLASDITGPRLFERFNAGWYRQRTALLHQTGKLVTIHNDGALRGCLPLLEGCGFDGAEALTPAPVGDLEAEKLRETAGTLVIWGGLPGALFSSGYSDEEFEQHLDRILRTFSQDKRFVLGVADQVPPDGKWERIRLVRQKLDDWNRERGYEPADAG